MSKSSCGQNFHIGLEQLEIPNMWFNPMTYWSGIRDVLFNLIIRMACLYIFNSLFLFWVEKLINQKSQNCLCLFMVVRTHILRFTLLNSVFLLIFISRGCLEVRLHLIWSFTVNADSFKKKKTFPHHRHHHQVTYPWFSIQYFHTQKLFFCHFVTRTFNVLTEEWFFSCYINLLAST